MRWKTNERECILSPTWLLYLNYCPLFCKCKCCFKEKVSQGSSKLYVIGKVKAPVFTPKIIQSDVSIPNYLPGEGTTWYATAKPTAKPKPPNTATATKTSGINNRFCCLFSAIVLGFSFISKFLYRGVLPLHQALDVSSIIQDKPYRLLPIGVHIFTVLSARRLYLDYHDGIHYTF